jgi:hypothetical protein
MNSTYLLLVPLMPNLHIVEHNVQKNGSNTVWGITFDSQPRRLSFSINNEIVEASLSRALI